jgi:hypothetical protein
MTIKTPLPAGDTASPSRRSLAGASDAGEPEPIFALIDAARQARARLYEVLDDLNELEELEYSNKPDELSLAEVEEKESQCCRAIHDAEDAVLGAKPCTHAGVAAQLMFAAEIYSVNESDEYLVPLLVNAAWTIEGPHVSKIGLSERREPVRQSGVPSGRSSRRLPPMDAGMLHCSLHHSASREGLSSIVL